MKNAIVTGGAGLIGTGLCQALAARGFEVASFDLTDAPHPVEGVRHIQCDVADEASVEIAVAELGWDRLDLLVNNAGATTEGALGTPFMELSLTDWRR